MPNHVAARAAGLSVLCAILAACTSSGSQAPVTSAASTTRSATPSTQKPPTGDAVLVSKADAACSIGNAYRRAHPFPVANFDPSDPGVQDLPMVAAYLKKEPDVVGRLLRLDLPLPVATALTQVRKNVDAQIAAAANSDPQSFAHAAQDRPTVDRRLYAAWTPSGLGAAQACRTFFTA